jgi:hypothetical protein
MNYKLDTVSYIFQLLRKLRQEDCLNPGVPGQPGQQSEIPPQQNKRKNKKQL